MMSNILRTPPMARAALIVALMTIFVGISQVLLELVVASKFGTHPDLDAFYLAYILPAALVNVLAGGAILGAFSPAYLRVLTDFGDAAARELVGQAFLLLFAWLLIVSVVLVMCYPFLWGLGGPRYAPHAKALAVELFQMLLPFLILNGLSSLLCATLAARRRFALSSIAPALVPTIALVFLLAAKTTLGISALVIGLVLGASLQCAVLLVVLIRERLIKFSKTVVDSAQIRAVFGHYAWMLGAAALLAGISIVDQAMAGSLEAGSVAKLNFGTKLITMGLAFLTVIIGNAALPYFSRMVLEKDWTVLWWNLRKPLACIFLLGVLVALGLFFFSEPVVRVVYERGAFTHSDSMAVARVQSYNALYIPFYLVGVVGWRMLNALQRNDILIGVAGSTFLLNVASNLLLMPYLGIEGIVFGKTFVYGFWAVVILFFLRRKLMDNQSVGNMSNRAALAK